ncbi:MAG: winged helix-turn-helix transcriptional regulator [Cetobacterium sp.]
MGSLRTLEEYDLVKRKVYPEVPPKVEYSISEKNIDSKKKLCYDNKKNFKGGKYYEKTKPYYNKI